MCHSQTTCKRCLIHFYDTLVRNLCAMYRSHSAAYNPCRQPGPAQGLSLQCIDRLQPSWITQFTGTHCSIHTRTAVLRLTRNIQKHTRGLRAHRRDWNTVYRHTVDKETHCSLTGTYCIINAHTAG